ncbi:hypothetical protein HMPREF0971_02352, partial [Segatella oris F0302]
MRSTFSVIFYLKKDKVKKDGNVTHHGAHHRGRYASAVQLQALHQAESLGHQGGRALAR